MSPFTLELVTDPKQVQDIAKALESTDQIAFDTEFIRENTFYPNLEILQIATKQDAWLIDCRALSKKDLEPILKAFVDPKILKIVHAAHGDQECLLSAYGILAAPLFDTAVGASLVGLGDNIGLGNLIKSILGIELPKGYARTNWAKRPLPKPVLEYALLDVTHLIEAAQKLFDKLDQLERKAWSIELSSKFCERNLYEVPPEDISKRLAQSGKFNIKDYLVLLELVRWRETRVRELNVPRRWLAEDGVLIDLAKVKPTTLEQLQGFRGLSKGELKAPHAERILNAIHKGVNSTDEIPEEIRKRGAYQANATENQAMDLLRVCLALFADEFEIAAKHMVPPQNILPLVRLKPQSLEDLKSCGLVSSELGDEGMKDLFDVLTGAKALVLEKGRVRIR